MPPPNNQSAQTPRPRNGLIVETVVNTAQGAATQASSMKSDQFDTTFGCDLAQILSPLQIKKKAKDVKTDLPSMREIGINESEFGNFANRTFEPGEGGVVPYAEDLDPYFFNAWNPDSDHVVDDGDMNSVINKSDDDPDDPDLSVNKNTNINEVRTVGLRGPILVSGWGYDIGGKPVPAKKKEGDDSFKFSNKLGFDRAEWKTGPVDLLWDDERQVWAGGLPMLMGVATSDIEAPDDPTKPTTFTMEILRKRGETSTTETNGNGNGSSDDSSNGNGNGNGNGTGASDESPFQTLPGKPEEVTLSNFDPSLSQKIITKNREGDHDWEENPSLVWVLAIKMNYTWIPFYVGCPDECKAPEDCVALYKDDPEYAGQGGDEAKNWECEDGDCVFNPSGGDSGGSGSGGGGVIPAGTKTAGEDCASGECAPGLKCVNGVCVPDPQGYTVIN